jgi:hypothetical protein
LEDNLEALPLVHCEQGRFEELSMRYLRYSSASHKPKNLGSALPNMDTYVNMENASDSEEVAKPQPNPTIAGMAAISPTRPTRQAASKNVIVEESEDEISFNALEEEEFTPAPKRSSRKTSRRQTTANIETSPKKNA